MKLTTVILIATMLHVSAASMAQRLTINKTNISLSQVFKEIRKQTGFNVLWKTNQLDGTEKINARFNNLPLENVLERILSGKGLTYAVEENTVLIKPKEKTLVDEAVSLVKNAFQQDSILYRGIVLNEKGVRMPGATIRIKGAKTVQTTAADGTFVIRGPRQGTILVNYIGFTKQEIKIDASNLTLAISMVPAVLDLSGVEIVSTGYQDVPKERATGSFEVITAKQLQHSTDPNLLKRLEGITTSMNFNNPMTLTNSSAVTKGLNSQFDNSPLKNLTIRGKTTLTANASYDANTQHGIPLVIIDGIASPYSIDLINPDDVESITILKDAAANSIWGSRAANGVIVVKTKRGKFDTPLKISFNTNMNITDKIDLFYKKKMSVSEYIDAQILGYNTVYAGTYDPANTSTYIPDPNLTAQQRDAASPVYEIMNQQKMGRITQAQATSQINALRNNDIRDDYTKYFLRDAVSQNYTLSLNGGTKMVNYNFSGGYNKNLNNTQKSNDDRVNLNYSMSVRPVKNLELQGNIVYSMNRSNDQGSLSVITGVTDQNFYPYSRLADNQDNHLEIPTQYYRPSFVNLLETTYGNKILSYRYNPLDDIKESYNKIKTQTVNVNLGAKYQFLPWLSANATYSYSSGNTNKTEYYSQNSYYMRELINRYTTNANSLNPANGSVLPAFLKQIPLGGMLLPSEQNNDAHTARATINVNKTWNEKHDFTAIAGVDISQSYSISRQDQYYGYNDQTLTNYNVLDYTLQKPFLFQNAIYGSSAVIPLISGGMTDSKVRTVGIYSNLAYTYDKRYTVSASLRKDQSSEFGVGTNRRGTPFYSFGTAWNINNEKFYHIDWLNMLKLRATFGYNGNVNPAVTSRPYLTINPGAQSIVTVTGLQTFTTATGISNRNLRPEKTGILNFGLDFAMLRNRISGSIEYYDKKTSDLLDNAPLDPSIGYSATVLNTANLRGRGVDITLNTVNVRAGKFSWSSSLLFSWNKVKVTKLFVTSVQNERTVVASNTAYNEGYDLSRIFAYRWAGLDPLTGDPRGYLNGKVVTINNTRAGSIAYSSLTEQPFTEARYFGSAVPVYYGSFRHTFNYAQFSLSANFMYKLGYYFRRSNSDIVNYGNLFGSSNLLQPAEYDQRWQKPGDELITNVPSQVYTTSNDSRNSFYAGSEVNVLKADHVRLQEVNFSYAIPVKKDWFLKNPRVYANVNNLGIIWRANKQGLDPDINDYPNPRSYSLGFSANF